MSFLRRESPIKKAIIFANATYEDLNFYEKLIDKHKNYTLIAVDGGLNLFYKLKKKPDLIIGDLDSVDKKVLKKFKKIKRKTFPEIKDFTDTRSALEYLQKSGCKKVIMTGVWGNRIDHSLANISLLERFSKKMDISLLNEHNKAKVYFAPVELDLHLKKGTTCSLLALNEELRGISLEGFFYPLEKFDLKRIDADRCVSNVAVKNKQKIKIESGTVLLDIIKDPDK